MEPTIDDVLTINQSYMAIIVVSVQESQDVLRVVNEKLKFVHPLKLNLSFVSVSYNSVDLPCEYCKLNNIEIPRRKRTWI